MFFRLVWPKINIISLPLPTNYGAGVSSRRHFCCLLEDVNPLSNGESPRNSWMISRILTCRSFRDRVVLAFAWWRCSVYELLDEVKQCDCCCLRERSVDSSHGQTDYFRVGLRGYCPVSGSFGWGRSSLGDRLV